MGAPLPHLKRGQCTPACPLHGLVSLLCPWLFGQQSLEQLKLLRGSFPAPNIYLAGRLSHKFLTAHGVQEIGSLPVTRPPLPYFLYAAPCKAVAWLFSCIIPSPLLSFTATCGCNVHLTPKLHASEDKHFRSTKSLGQPSAVQGGYWKSDALPHFLLELYALFREESLQPVTQLQKAGNMSLKLS